MSDYIELTVAEAEALRAGIEFGSQSQRSLELEVKLMREELGLSKFDPIPENARYLRALDKLVRAGVTDPGGTLNDIDKEK